MDIQAILFYKNEFTRASAKRWLSDNDFNISSVEETENYYKFKQKEPELFEFKTLRNITWPWPGLKPGIKVIIGEPLKTKKKRKNSDLAMTAFHKGIKSSLEGNPKAGKKATMKVFGNSAIRVNSYGNPIHIPRKDERGRPSKNYWWILDLYSKDEKKLATQIGQGAKRNAEFEAAGMIGSKTKGKKIESAMLSGPYRRKPTLKTKRR